MNGWREVYVDFGAQNGRKESYRLVGHSTTFGFIFRLLALSNGVAKGYFQAPEGKEMFIVP